MNVTLNGYETQLGDGPSVADAVASLSPEDPALRGVAVAVNGEVVARSRWQTVRLREGDRVEVLRAVGGG